MSDLVANQDNTSDGAGGAGGDPLTLGNLRAEMDKGHGVGAGPKLERSQQF